MIVPPRYLLAVGLLVLTAAGAGALAWWTVRSRAAEIPPVRLEGADPDVAAAIRAAVEDLRAAPRSGEKWGHLGMVLRAHSFGDEANICFQEAERLDPTEPRWPYYRGLTLVLTDPPGGLACLQRAVGQMKGGMPPAAFRLAEVLLEQGQFDEAERRLGEGRPNPADVARLSLLRARLASARRDWKAVIQYCQPCLSDPRARKQVHFLLADAYRRSGDEQSAARLTELGRALPEDEPFQDPLVAEVERLRVGLQARLGEAATREEQGDVQGAVSILERLTTTYPRDAQPWLLLGQILRRQNQLAPSEQALARAVRLDPDSVEAWFMLGNVRVLLGRPQPASEAFREVLRRKPDHALASHNLGVCLKALGDIEGARRAWRDALRSQPDYSPSKAALEESAK